MEIDIVITSRNRLEYLQQTLEHLFKRTKHPYRLHIIDDNSQNDVIDYLLSLWYDNYLSSLLLNNDRKGIQANKNISTWLALSNPFVISADDILCPDLEPCWLSQALDIMKKYPDLGELDLNHHGAYRINQDENEDIFYCEVVGGTLGLINRQALSPLPHFVDNFGQGDDVKRCDFIRQNGYRVGYIKDIYCHHIGINSTVQPTGKYQGPIIENYNKKTLEPIGD